MASARTDNLVGKLLNRGADALPAQIDTILQQPDGESKLFRALNLLVPSNPTTALQLARKLEDRLIRSGDKSLALPTYRLLAQTQRALGSHQDAIISYEAVRNGTGNTTDDLSTAQHLTGYVDSLGIVGRPEDALKLADSLFRTLIAGGDLLEAANVMINAGNILYRRDDFNKALGCYDRAESLFTGEAEKKNRARVMANRANVLTQLHREEEAAKLLQQAGELFAECGMELSVGMVQANEGYLQFISGRHISAISLLNLARELFQAHGRLVETAKCDADIAEVYRELNLLSESRECATRAIQTFQSIPMPYEEARAEMTLASVYSAQGLPDDSLESLIRAKAIFDSLGNTLYQSIVHLMTARVLHQIGREDEAASACVSSLDGFKKSHIRAWQAEAELFQMELSASSILSEAKFRSIISTAKSTGRPWLLARAERAYGQYLLTTGKNQPAVSHLRKSVEALEVVRTGAVQEDIYTSFIEDKISIYEDLVSQLLARGRAADIGEALQVVEKARSRMLLERMHSTLEKQRTEDISEDKKANLLTLRAKLSRAFHRMHSTEPDSLQRRAEIDRENSFHLRSLERTYKKALLDQEISLAAPNSAENGIRSIPSVSMLQSAIADDESLIEYFAVNGMIGAFILDRQQIVVVKNIASSDELSHYTRRLRYHIQRAEIMDRYFSTRKESMQEELVCLLQKLYQLLLAPVLDRLRHKKIVVILHGLLHGIPIHALHDGSNYVLDNYETVYAASASTWYLSRTQHDKNTGLIKDSATSGTLLMAIPSKGIERVSGEVDGLAKSLEKPIVFHGEEATIQAFRENAPRCKTIHIATHAVFREDSPLFSALKFSDGWLLARDLYDIKLNCDLATLSACRTGSTFVAPGDEIYGLARGFLFAGVRSLAVSLWPADDEATSELMPLFYEGINQGKSHARALRDAQKTMRLKYPHPYHWAPFIIIGER